MESSLTLKKSDFESKVGVFAGWGNGVTDAWDARKQDAITDSVNSGLRQFYFPAPPYSWSFLRPFASLTLPSAATALLLPADFGGVEGPVYFSTSGGSQYAELPTVGVGMIETEARRSPSTSGRPVMCAIEPVRGTSFNGSQPYQLRVWPTSDQAYAVRVRYYLLPDCLSDSYPYAYGGAQHSETILESCLAIYEERYDDQIHGVHGQKFKERLAASIQADQRMKAQTLGYNGDMTPKLGDRFQSGRGLIRVYVNGVLPGV